jgi:hypothetical protein
VSALSQLINERMAERGIKYGRELARLTEGPARRRGVKPVTSANASTYIKGAHGKPSERTLDLLADALALPSWKLRKAAGLAPGEPEPYRPPPEANRLNRRQRQAVNAIIHLLAESRPADGSAMLGTPPEQVEVGWEDQAGQAPPVRNSSDTQDSIDDASSESTGNGQR